ncbi:MAG: FG-GAP repeat protein, partial [Candidatus Rokuibacteriota bacterium]
MILPPRTVASGRAAGVVIAALAALLAPAGAEAQLPGPPQECILLQTADAAAGDLFACALAAGNGTVAVGSVLDDDLGADSGSVYVFTRGGNGVWAQRAKILAADGAAGDQLGFAVGLDGGRIAAGAPFRNQVGLRSGAVYVFEGGGAAWTQTAKLVPAGLGARDEL